MRVTMRSAVAQANGWQNARGSSGPGRSRPRSGARSLKDALSDAGFGEPSSATHRPDFPGPDEDRAPADPVAREGSRAGQDAAPALRNLLASIGLSSDQPDANAPLIRQVPTSSVVSPPPWLRAKRRGQLHARVLNTFGWLMTLLVVGSIVGLAGRYLVVPPPGGVHIQARQ